MAQNSTVQVNPDLNRNSLKDGGEVPGFISSPPEVDLLRNAIKNPDGTRTIKAGQQTPEANELNRQYCESYGARDITNEADLTIVSGTLFAGVCQGSIGKHPPASIQVIPGTGTGRIFLPIPTASDLNQPVPEISTRAAVQINPYATNGSSPYGMTYYANAYVDFFNMPSTNQASGVGAVKEVAPCSWTRALGLGPGNATISGYAACTPSLDFAQSVMTGCYAGSCKSSYGTVSHY